MSFKEPVYSNAVTKASVDMYTSVTVAQNEPILNEVMNRGVGELDYNTKQLDELNKMVFSQLNISEYVQGHAYNVGDLVWYKNSLNVTYLLKCIRQENTQEPDTSGLEGQKYSKRGDDILQKSGWENQNRNLSILDYEVMALVQQDAQAVISDHEDDQTMHPFGKLANGLETKLLMSDMSNIDLDRSQVVFPLRVVRVPSGIAVTTGYQRIFGDVVEYDIILKLACATKTSFTQLFQDVQPLSANNVTFSMFSGISKSSQQYQTNGLYFINEADMDIFAPESDYTSRCGIVMQHQRNDYVNTYSAKVTFPVPFSTLDYMVFSNTVLSQTVGSSTLVPSANDIAYCDKTRQSITFIDITFPDSTKYGEEGYNATHGGLVANSFHMKVIGKVDRSLVV